MTKKTPVTQSIRTTSQLIITVIMVFGYQSIRSLAQQLGLSKSSVHRHLKAYRWRNQPLASQIWETAEGRELLRRIYCAVIYQFGLKYHIGASRLSEFFCFILAERHVGVSEDALRVRMRELEKLLSDFQQQQEATARSPEPARTVAMDETFFNKMMILVMADLPSGYLLLEEPAEDRSYATWQARACGRLSAMGLTVKHAVSDRAKALMKLSLDGFHCHAGADLFHAQYELSRWLALPLARTRRQMTESLEKARQQWAKYQKKGHRTSNKLYELETAVKQAEQDHQQCVDAQTAYRQHQQAISNIVHPFDPATGLAQDQSTVLAALKYESDEVEQLAKDRLISDSKRRLQKFRNQLDDLSQHVGVWWYWIHALLADAAPDPILRAWVVNRMMPVLYWHSRLCQTKKKEQRQLYQMAWKKAVKALQEDPFTQSLPEEQITQWRLWCERKVKHFQRTSSAVEGRNGCLSQAYHNGRGLTPSRLKALSVIHNYGIRHWDGSTPANRLFEREFPDLFEWLLAEMKPLPLARKRRGRKESNPLIG
jgi:hypothetical protein